MKILHLSIMAIIGISIFGSEIAFAQSPPPLIPTNETDSSSSYHYDVPVPAVVYWLVIAILAGGGTSILILKKIK